MSKIDISVGRLVEMVKDGELRLPEMQRRYVWTATRVRDLLDSLYRGYPSGTILVWQTDQAMPSRDLDVEQMSSPFKGHMLLLDGQQRLTSLVAVTRGEPVTVRNRRRPIDILFNIDHPDGPPVEVTEVDEGLLFETDESENGDDEGNGITIQQRLRQRAFVVASRALAADPYWIKVSDIFSPDVPDAQLLKPLVSSFDDPRFEKFSKRLQAVRKIKEYQYVMQVLDKHLSYEEVAEIFVRVNSLGIKLRGSDLALAQITSRWKASLQQFEQFQEECEEQRFALDLGLLVRALVVFSTGQSRFKSVANIPLDRLRAGWEEAKDGVRFAINFLRANAGIENEQLLSSPFFVITIAYFGHKIGYRLSVDLERRLRRWLYIGNSRGHYSGSSETTIDSDLNIIDAGGQAAELTASLEKQVGRLSIDSSDLTGKGQRSALFAMAYLALKARGAKDWQTRLGLSLSHQGKEHSVEYHHIFPKSALKKFGYPESDINEIANMVFMAGRTNRRIGSRLPAEYLPEIVDEQGAEALESHCVPTDPALWDIQNYGRFLEWRRSALAAAINAFLEGSTPEVKLVDVEALIDAGENEMVEFKASARWDYRQRQVNKALELPIVKTVAAFMNSKGGTLLIGVSDDSAVVGLDDDLKTLKRQDLDGYQQFLANLLSTTIGPAAASLCDMGMHQVDNRSVCAIHAPTSAVPVYVDEGNKQRLFVRTGSTTQELDTRDAVEYINSHWAQA